MRCDIESDFERVVGCRAEPCPPVGGGCLHHCLGDSGLDQIRQDILLGTSSDIVLTLAWRSSPWIRQTALAVQQARLIEVRTAQSAARLDTTGATAAQLLSEYLEVCQMDVQDG